MMSFLMHNCCICLYHEFDLSNAVELLLLLVSQTKEIMESVKLRFHEICIADAKI